MRKRSSVHPWGTRLMSKKGKKTSKSMKLPPRAVISPLGPSPPPAKTSPGSLGQGCVNRCRNPAPPMAQSCENQGCLQSPSAWEAGDALGWAARERHSLGLGASLPKYRRGTQHLPALHLSSVQAREPKHAKPRAGRAAGIVSWAPCCLSYKENQPSSASCATAVTQLVTPCYVPDSNQI